MKLTTKVFKSVARTVRNSGYNPYDTAQAHGKAFARNLGRRLEHMDCKSEHAANRYLKPQAG
jgi:hypothetical protein